jgi:hypothetical protein
MSTTITLCSNTEHMENYAKDHLLAKTDCPTWFTKACIDAGYNAMANAAIRMEKASKDEGGDLEISIEFNSWFPDWNGGWASRPAWRVACGIATSAKRGTPEWDMSDKLAFIFWAAFDKEARDLAPIVEADEEASAEAEAK